MKEGDGSNFESSTILLGWEGRWIYLPSCVSGTVYRIR